MGPPPLWSVAGEGGFGSGLEGSVDCGGIGWAPRPDPAREGKREGRGSRLDQAVLPPLPAGPSLLLPRLGDEGASSFGLRLRTGERCSRRGRSERHKDLAGGSRIARVLLPVPMQSPSPPVCVFQSSHCWLQCLPPPLPPPPQTHPAPRGKSCSSVGGDRARTQGLSDPCSRPSGSLISQTLISLVAPSR